MASSHGGARANSGRKPKRIKYSAPVNKSEKKLAAHLEKAAENLIVLADGGFLRITRVMKMAGSLTKSEFVEKEGPRGGITMQRIEVPMFPDLPAEQLICVEEKHEIAEPDRAANEYLFDRIGGRAGQMEEVEVEKKGEAKATDDARKAGMEKMKLWRQTSAEQLDSIRNPLTGATMEENENESMNGQNTQIDSSTMDEF